MGLDIERFSVFGIWFGVVILAGFVLDFSQAMFMEYTGQKIMLNLRCRLFDHMTDLPVAYFDKNASGRLVARVAGDIENMNEMFTSVLVFIFRDLLLMAGVFVILFFYQSSAYLLFKPDRSRGFCGRDLFFGVFFAGYFGR